MTLNTVGFIDHTEQIDAACDSALLLRARYDEARFSPALFEMNGILRPASLANAVDRRQAEYLAGRLLASQALSHLALPVQDVLQAPDRRPLFPHGLSGSISHARGHAACLVTRSGDPGVDIEAMLSGDALNAVWSSAFTETDRQILRSAEPMLVTAVFSAKESLFKALYPSVGRFFGFEAATLTDRPLPTGLTLRLTESLSGNLPAGRCFDIRCHWQTDHVLTWLIHQS